ncbi:uncharacterized protein LOC129701472 [Leucoraja erinacea]|uniref:uncharacterized protein LOC129701472 n=1 Tax=Leucoraja erinaceus TaxID=7782 RepID=UPI002458905D|nr:uncharacterized protein LOC129701472 [Leucoraja erinacea]
MFMKVHSRYQADCSTTTDCVPCGLSTVFSAQLTYFTTSTLQVSSAVPTHFPGRFTDERRRHGFIPHARRTGQFRTSPNMSRREPGCVSHAIQICRWLPWTTAEEETGAISEASTSKDCGKPEDPIHFSSMIIKPDLVVLPGSVTVEWTAELSREIKGLSAKVQFLKKNGKTWDKIECPPIYNCNVNFCELLGKEKTCVLNQGPLIRTPQTYSYTESIPSGKYHGQFIFMSGGKRIGCLDVKYEIKAE